MTATDRSARDHRQGQWRPCRLALLLCLVCWLAACDDSERLHIRVGDSEALVEIANTPDARRQGLMHRRQLGENEGMLFVFPGERVLQMWMLNTLIPLDAGFFDADGVLLNHLTMQPDGGRRIHRSAAPARYVLEMNSGWFRRAGIEPGAKLQLPRTIRAH